MGSDQLFHKRKARSAASFKRKGARRSPYDRVLIVCEGKKTEPDYFKAVIDDLQLNTANIRIAENTAGSSPRNVVELALEEYAKDKREKGEPYDRVYCVFDKDQHPTYQETLDVVRREREKKKRGCPIYAITSVPCFEFWLLLHFTYTTKNFSVKGGSICASVMADLKKYMPSYEKGGIKNIYHVIRKDISGAITHAKRAERHCESGGTDMPSTQVYALVEYLQQLKKK
ncbi:MAG: RloB family protein [Candidatus Electrothrix sp. GW3-4]|uniref:RloB family protein n=1 Tax=Candidatus Electrothrix sp. GW3-4 TaxID=3126740 RepID=UPI0030D58FAC